MHACVARLNADLVHSPRSQSVSLWPFTKRPATTLRAVLNLTRSTDTGAPRSTACSTIPTAAIVENDVRGQQYGRLPRFAPHALMLCCLRGHAGVARASMEVTHLHTQQCMHSMHMTCASSAHQTFPKPSRWSCTAQGQWRARSRARTRRAVESTCDTVARPAAGMHHASCISAGYTEAVEGGAQAACR